LRAEFKQKKESILHKIRENPSTIILYRKPMVDDGMGGEIEDPFGVDTEAVLVVRIFHNQSNVPATETNIAGFGSNLHRSILSTEIVYENEVFEAIGTRFRIGKVDTIKAFGGTVGYQADLYEASEAVSGEYT